MKTRPLTISPWSASQALATGNVQWASDPALTSLFHDAAVMVALDGQRYSGMAAIIRRLNGGVLCVSDTACWDMRVGRYCGVA